MNFKYLIVDDEPFARKLIAAHASKIAGLELSGQYGNAIEASNHIRSTPVDLVFLDIQMPEIDGLKFISTLKNPPAIIITTAFRDFGPEAFDLDVVDYLLKPISFERLLKAVNKFFDRTSTSPAQVIKSNEAAYVYFRADRKMHKVGLNDILYIESLDEYVKVYLNNKTLITRESISTLEQKLPEDQFVRIHRSFLVSIKAVQSISAEGVDIAGKSLPFGRAFRQSALASLKVRI
jgi:DNA-binding LytR/AlgR family response regulator